MHGRLLHIALLCAGVAVAVFVTQFDTSDDSSNGPGPLFQQSLNSIENAPGSDRALYAAAPLVRREQSAEPALVEDQAGDTREGSEPGSQALSAVEEGLAFFTYVVEDGDDLSSIAGKFDLREETLVNNNYDLEAADYSETGRQIIVLATDGMLHTVKFGEDLFFIADLYKTAPEEIVNYGPNGLADADDLSIGRVVVVPEGQAPTPQVLEEDPDAEDPDAEEDQEEQDGTPTEEPDEEDPTDEPADDPTEDPTDEPTPEPTEEPTQAPPPDDGGSVDGWTWPVSGCGITRGVSGSHAGIDIDLFCNPGATVVAAASGTVIYAGWDGGYGNSVVIDHGNGLFSRYAHLSSVSVSSGQSVSGGQTIGVSGNTGNSQGEHLHFEIRQGSAYGTILDPLAYLP